jgi:hypothetical protein
MSSKLRRKAGRPHKTRKVTLSKPLPLNGDHGTGTQAARAGTVLEKIMDNPNHMGQRKRVCRVDWLLKRKFLDTRQYQAAKAIQVAYARTEQISSGGELKEQVQSSSKPDAAMAQYCDAMSAWVRVMKAVRRSQRPIVEHVCCYNQPITSMRGATRIRSAHRLRSALNAVADHMQY